MFTPTYDKTKGHSYFVKQFKRRQCPDWRHSFFSEFKLIGAKMLLCSHGSIHTLPFCPQSSHLQSLTASVLLFLVNQENLSSPEWDGGDWGYHTYNTYSVQDSRLSEPLWVCQLALKRYYSLYYISEPGNKCFTLIFTGQRLPNLSPALL